MKELGNAGKYGKENTYPRYWFKEPNNQVNKRDGICAP